MKSGFKRNIFLYELLHYNENHCSVSCGLTLCSLCVDVLVRVHVSQDGGVGGDGSGLGRRNQNEKHQDKKGKAICKYYIEGRCTWVRHHKCVRDNSGFVGKYVILKETNRRYCSTVNIRKSKK